MQLDLVDQAQVEGLPGNLAAGDNHVLLSAAASNAVSTASWTPGLNATRGSDSAGRIAGDDEDGSVPGAP